MNTARRRSVLRGRDPDAVTDALLVTDTLAGIVCLQTSRPRRNVPRDHRRQ
jgi:hypothetical protein